MALRFLLSLCLLCIAVSCGTDEPVDAGVDAGTCDIQPFEVGDDGHADPLAVGRGQARAGRIRADLLPPLPSRLAEWEDGDFVLANEHVAMVIEDAGESARYDPWGGRPVGIARVEGGALVEPGDFGEILVLLGTQSILTQRVSVMNDGSDGAAAIVRAEGVPRPLPFFADLVGPLLPGDFAHVWAAIDYVLEPGARHVDVFIRLRAPNGGARASSTMNAFMHTPRMPPFAPAVGFDFEGATVPWLGFADPTATSFAYSNPTEDLGGGLEISGFASVFTRGSAVNHCEEAVRHHAQITLGGPGIGGLVEAVLIREGIAPMEITGTVRDASTSPAEDVWVIATDSAGFVSRTRTDASGQYRLAVDPASSVSLTAFRRGDTPTTPTPFTANPADITLNAGGFVHVVATEDGNPVPVRVQLLSAAGPAPAVDRSFGIPRVPSRRIQVEYPANGDVTLRAPAGDVRVVISRGFEYEIVEQTVNVAEGATVEVVAALDRVVDTTDVMCADFHIHTHRSNDSGDTATLKLRSAIADGVELPVRSDHEYVASFQSLIEELNLEAYAYGVGSIEMTTFEAWGHFGVVPLVADPTRLNAGAPEWQTYPSIESPDDPVLTMSPVDVFATIRARAEAPVIIINHPRGGANYFTYAGYDNVTGVAMRPEVWDEDFRLVEVFNDDDWLEVRDGIVADWLSLLDHGRRVFAVGSSDSHSISNSPVGYPRTCLELGTDDPAMTSDRAVRDALAAGHATISGGVYVDTWVGTAGPGDEASGLGATADLRIRVQAANWVDVDRFDIVVDGATVQTIDILPTDADPLNSVIRYDATVQVDVAMAGSYVLVAAYGDMTLEPVHSGRLPFGVANPIFLNR